MNLNNMFTIQVNIIHIQTIQIVDRRVGKDRWMGEDCEDGVMEAGPQIRN